MMRARKIGQRLQRAVDQLPHPELDKIWKESAPPMPEHDYITRQERAPARRAKHTWKWAAACTACLVALLVGGYSWYGENLSVSAVVDLDVNPSFEIALNRQDKVLKVDALNADARKILSGRNYQGWDIEDTLETLLIAMDEGQYLSDKDNAVLLSVSAGERTQSLTQALEGRIYLASDTAQIPVTVHSQTMDGDDALRQTAADYEVSAGKLYLVREVAGMLPDYTEAELANLSIGELLRLAGLDHLADLEDPQAAPSATPAQSTPVPTLAPAPTPAPTPVQTARPAKTPVQDDDDDQEDDDDDDGDERDDDGDDDGDDEDDD